MVPVGNKIIYMPFLFYSTPTVISCLVFAQTILSVCPSIRTLILQLYNVELPGDVYNKALNDSIRLEELEKLHVRARKTCFLEVT